MVGSSGHICIQFLPVPYSSPGDFRVLVFFLSQKAWHCCRSLGSRHHPYLLRISFAHCAQVSGQLIPHSWCAADIYFLLALTQNWQLFNHLIYKLECYFQQLYLLPLNAKEIPKHYVFFLVVEMWGWGTMVFQYSSLFRFLFSSSFILLVVQVKQYSGLLSICLPFLQHYDFYRYLVFKTSSLLPQVLLTSR